MATNGSEERRALTILWRIENVRRLESKDGWNYAHSPPFRSRTLEGKRFHLYFIPEENGKVILSLYLCDDPISFPIDCEWALVLSNGSTVVGGSVENLVLKKRTFFYISSDCLPHEEVCVTRKSEFLPHDTLTVRCRIWKSNTDLPNDEFISCRTRIDTTEHSFPWPIPGFSSLELNKEVTTPVILGDYKLEENFLVKFSLKGTSFDDAVVNVELTPVSIRQGLIVKSKLSIVDEEQKVIKCIESEFKTFLWNSKQCLTFPYFLSRKELMEKKLDTLRNDVLTLHCEITIVRFTTFIEKYHHSWGNTKSDISEDFSTFLDASCQTSEPSLDLAEISFQGRSSLASLCEDFRNLYLDQNLTDFKLCSGDVTFPVHRNVLVARSPVFKAMFSTEMEESDSGSMHVPDLDSHTLNRMLIFFYTGTLEEGLGLENASKLYYAADKYQVDSLKQECSSILRSNISVSNVSDILTLADRHQDKELTSFVHDFFLNHFDEIMQSKEWESFNSNNPALAGNTVLVLYKKKLLSKLP